MHCVGVEPPECLRLTHNMVDKLLKISGDVEGLDCIVVDDMLDKANRHIFAYYRRARSSMRLLDMARIASDGTEDLTKMRWRFSVMIKKHVRVGT